MDKTWIIICVCASVCLRECLGTSERYYMEDECARMIDMEKLGLESVRMELTKFQEYHNDVDCIVRFTAPNNKRLEVKILKNEIESSPGCTKDFLQMYDGQELINNYLPRLEHRVCSITGLETSYTTTGQYLTIRFRSDDEGAADGFRILVTAYRTDPDDVCYNTEFQCKQNKRCISEHLVCDTFKDCSDNSDECSLSIPAIIGLAVGGVVLILVIVAVVVCCCCCRHKRQRSGSTKHLSNDISDSNIGPGDEQDLEVSTQYYRPSSIHQPIHQPLHALPSHHSHHSDSPYADGNMINSSYHKPEVQPARHVFITPPPTHVLKDADGTIFVPYRY